MCLHHVINIKLTVHIQVKIFRAFLSDDYVFLDYVGDSINWVNFFLANESYNMDQVKQDLQNVLAGEALAEDDIIDIKSANEGNYL